MDRYDEVIDEMIDYINFKIQREKDMSVRQLADILQIPSSSLHSRLQKERKMELKTLLKLIDYFGISIDSFLYSTNGINCNHDVDCMSISINIKHLNKEKQKETIKLLDKITDTLV